MEVTTRKIKEMHEVAYRPSEITLPDEELAYIVIRNPGRNITVTPPARLGGDEYPKTYGHYHEPQYPETYQVLYGKAGFLTQKIEGDTVVEAALKIVLQGGKFKVPAGYAHISINLGNDYLITVDDHDPAHFDNNYEPIKAKCGLAYYIVQMGGKIEAVPNPAYQNVPPLKING